MQNVGVARLYPAISAVALSASLLVSLFTLAPHLRSGSGVESIAETEVRPPIAAAASSRAEAEALARRLSAHLEKQPRDARAWAILARLQFEMDHFAEAARAYEKALALPSKVANDPAVWCEYADAFGMTQGGKLAGKPRALIERALVLNPNHPKALEMAGSAEYARGDYAAALRYWRPLLAALEPGSQLQRELAAAIARAERFGMLAVPPQRQ
jgi:cytochrome c-type biogenesis protein CcmH